MIESADVTCYLICLKEKQRSGRYFLTLLFSLREMSLQQQIVYLRKGEKKKTTHHVTLFQLPQALFCLKPSLTLTPSVIRAICHRRAGNHFLPSHGHLNINAVGTMELYHTNLLIPFIFHFTATFVSIHRSNSVLFCLAQKY